MRILIIAMSESIHTARWISQIADQGWEIHLFPSIDSGYVHPDIQNATVYHSVYCRQEKKHISVRIHGMSVAHHRAAHFFRKILHKINPCYREKQLAKLINKIKPDVVHSMEIQHAGYLTLEAKKTIGGHFPPWIVTNWGSDIYLFGRLSEHDPKIREVLGGCDYYSCECTRDVALAKEFNLKGRILPVFPNTGGFHLENISRLRQAGPVASRRKIMLKGYQTWAGRALVGLRALERCADVLRGYEVILYSTSADVLIAAELFQKATGVPVRILAASTPHDEILRFHGQARVSIGLSISDAISTSCLEALVMGSFPIQSWTSCADEWLEHGKTGMLVPPEDPEVVEQAIRRALTDDDMVNRAAELNYKLASKKLDYSLLKKSAVELYDSVIPRKGLYDKK